MGGDQKLDTPPAHLIAETQTIWDHNASHWDARHGDTGNEFHRTIVQPVTLDLLAPKPDEHILEIACGNGAFARTLARLGLRVVATDFSRQFLECARNRTTEHHDRIDYRHVDATDEAALLQLGERRFDAAVCNMALMDMAAIAPLFAALSRLLKPQGRFVFSVMHPCFNSNGAAKMAETTDVGELTTVYSIKVTRYLTPWTELGIGMSGQPEPHHYFHRPISALLNAAFHAGFVLDALEEPVDPGQPRSEHWKAWENYKETPPVLVARLRRLE